MNLDETKYLAHCINEMKDILKDKSISDDERFEKIDKEVFKISGYVASRDLMREHNLTDEDIAAMYENDVFVSVDEPSVAYIGLQPYFADKMGEFQNITKYVDKSDIDKIKQTNINTLLLKDGNYRTAFKDAVSEVIYGCKHSDYYFEDR